MMTYLFSFFNPSELGVHLMDVFFIVARHFVVVGLLIVDSVYYAICFSTLFDYSIEATSLN